MGVNSSQTLPSGTSVHPSVSPLLVPMQPIDYEGFQLFMATYLENDIPEELCQHLFTSFKSKTGGSSPDQPQAGTGLLGRPLPFSAPLIASSSTRPSFALLVSAAEIAAAVTPLSQRLLGVLGLDERCQVGLSSGVSPPLASDRGFPLKTRVRKPLHQNSFILEVPVYFLAHFLDVFLVFSQTFAGV